jgi:hypothetical protein
MHKEQCDQARQHEVMRQQSTTITVTLAGAIIAAATATGPHVLSGLQSIHHQVFFVGFASLGIFIMGLGFFGERICLKHYERNRYHTTLAGYYRYRLEQMAPDAAIGKALRSAAYAQHRDKWAEDTRPIYREMVEYRVHRGWLMVHRFIILSGAVVAMACMVIAVAPVPA